MTSSIRRASHRRISGRRSTSFCRCAPRVHRAGNEPPLLARATGGKRTNPRLFVPRRRSRSRTILGFLASRTNRLSGKAVQGKLVSIRKSHRPRRPAHTGTPYAGSLAKAAAAWSNVPTADSRCQETKLRDLQGGYLSSNLN